MVLDVSNDYGVLSRLLPSLPPSLPHPNAPHNYAVLDVLNSRGYVIRFAVRVEVRPTHTHTHTHTYTHKKG
jgi:hypothetical protein